MLTIGPKKSYILSIKEQKLEKENERQKDQMKSPMMDNIFCARTAR